MFRLSNSEIDSVRSQIVTSRKKDFFAGQEGGRRYLPYAFTEQGIYMLATVLRGKLAEQQSIFIMRTFREMRHYIRQNQQFVTRNEMDLLTAKAEKFIRIGEYRMNKAVDALGRLENLANCSSYEYTQEQVDAMFQALEGRVAEIKSRFAPKKAQEGKSFSFGAIE